MVKNEIINGCSKNIPQNFGGKAVVIETHKINIQQPWIANKSSSSSAPSSAALSGIVCLPKYPLKCLQAFGHGQTIRFKFPNRVGLYQIDFSESCNRLLGGGWGEWGKSRSAKWFYDLQNNLHKLLGNQSAFLIRFRFQPKSWLDKLNTSTTSKSN